jgi:pimeloyl-ACP methyl ester carboxylesterase
MHPRPRAPHADRVIAPLLQRLGSVVLLDHRGMGGSDVGFSSYTPADAGRDAVALCVELDLRNVVLLGCSVGAASAVWASVEAPERVAAALFLAPFAWDHAMSAFTRLSAWAGLRVWAGGHGAWGDYYASVYRRLPPDHAEYVASLKQHLAQPGRLDALRAQIFASKSDCEARIPAFLERAIPWAVVYGGADPDFRAVGVPAEAAEFARRFRVEDKEAAGKVVVLEGVGHFPHAEAPEAVMEVVARLLRDVAAAPVGGDGSRTATAGDLPPVTA